MSDTPAIIRSASDIAGASNDVLVSTYNALTGKSIKKFSSRAAGERQVEMAMLVAKDADGHTGVPKNSEPKVITHAEAQSKAEARGIPLEVEEDDAPIAFVPGSLADQLDKAARRAAPIVPRAKKEPKAPVTPRSTLTHVTHTPGGTSKVQANSTRGAVLKFIVERTGLPVSVAELDAEFNCNTKGFLQKLIEKDHIAPCDAEGVLADAAPVAEPAETETAEA